MKNWSEKINWSKQAPRWTLWLLILLGLYLRLHRLAFQSLGPEEATWVSRAQFPHVSEFWVRLPFALLGTLCIPFLYLLAKKIFGVLEGILAAGFLATLWSPVYYSQSATQHSVLLLLILISSYYFLLWLSAEIAPWSAKPLCGLIFCVSAVCLGYVHPVGLLYVGFLMLAGVLFLWRHRVPIRTSVFLAAGLILALSSFAISDLLESGFQHLQLDVLTSPPLQNLSDQIRFMLGGSPAFDLFCLVLMLALVLYRLLFRWLVARPGMARFLRTEDLMLILLALVTLGPWALSHALGDSLFLRDSHLFLIPMLAAYLLLARALSEFLTIRLFRYALVFIFPLYCVHGLCVSRAYYVALTKPEIRDAVKWIASNDTASPTKAIACSQYGDSSSAVLNFYFGRFGLPMRTEASLGSDCSVDLNQRILPQTPDPIWLVTWSSQTAQKDCQGLAKELPPDRFIDRERTLFELTLCRIVKRPLRG